MPCAAAAVKGGTLSDVREVSACVIPTTNAARRYGLGKPDRANPTATATSPAERTSHLPARAPADLNPLSD